LVILLAALDYRQRTGHGCSIDLSQAETGIHFLAPQMLDYFEQGHVVERLGNRDPYMSPRTVSIHAAIVRTALYPGSR